MKLEVNDNRCLPPRILLTALLSLVVAGCQGSPSAPSDVSPPPPPPTLVTISGLVRHAGNSAGLAATVHVIDGPNAGQTATTDGTGAYTLPGLTFAGFSITVSAAGYVPQSRAVLLTAGATAKSENFLLLPTGLWSLTGRGNTVFDMPTYVSRVRIVGTTTSRCENFIVHMAGRGVVNVILGTCSIADARSYDGIHVTSGGIVETLSSTGIAWTFTEVR